MIRESETVELKVSLVETINKDVVAFANSEGGTIILGFDDSGRMIGQIGRAHV